MWTGTKNPCHFERSREETGLKMFSKSSMINLKFIPAFCFFILLSSCGNKKEEVKAQKIADDSILGDAPLDPKNYFKDCKRLFDHAQEVDSILYTKTEVNKVLANKAIKAFTDYAYYCHNDSLSPIFLIKAGQVAQSINNAPQAKVVLEKCIEEYPNFEGIPTALFLLGQLYDEKIYLNNEEEARRLYTEIVNKYPNSPEAESAKGALRFIGKTDKEIIEELKKDLVKQKNTSVTITQ